MFRNRQRRIHNRSGITLSGVDDTSLGQYLYDEYETLCPVLAVVAELVDTIQSCRTRCDR
ncbi:DUF7260 family protein [Haloarcula rubra]|uniref:DUF7260 family protein n=1 Tax=Haloarcula rubra TaxID=2487747 RepID=UPI003CCB7E64